MLKDKDEAMLVVSCLMYISVRQFMRIRAYVYSELDTTSL